MSGHSKWHNIQGRKGKQDALRANQFTKLAKMITVTARTGGGDAAMNFSLRLAIDKAKEAGMPKDNIERAIKRGTGELAEGAQIEEALYEGYGPGGVAVVVKVLTDNKNRTISDLKHIFSQHDGTLGSSGSVLWMFDQRGVAVIDADAVKNRDEFDLAMIDAGVDDIINGSAQIELRTRVENFQKVLATLKEKGIEPAESGLQWVAKNTMPVADEAGKKLEALFGALEENDDVEDYFTNAE